MTNFTRAATPLLTISALLGCSNTEMGSATTTDAVMLSESTASRASALLEELNAQKEIACDCHEEFGFSSTGHCLDAQKPIGPSKLECALEAFEEDGAAADPYLDCLLPLEREYTRCMDRSLECSRLVDSLETCSDDYVIGRRDCIELPQSVERDLENCDVSLALNIQVNDQLCGNSCRYAADGECDDGGLGAQTEACSYGTDCSDCGAR